MAVQLRQPNEIEIDTDTISGDRLLSKNSTFEHGKKQRLIRASILLTGVLSGFIFTAGTGKLSPEAARLLVILFGGQWLYGCIKVLQGESSLFIDRAYLALHGAVKFLKQLVNPNAKKISYQERTSLLFWIVKLIFIPFMLSVACKQAATFMAFLNLNSPVELFTSFTIFYFFWLVAVDMVDTCVATVGYSFESNNLGNVVRSVDTSLLGWLVVLLCYPPVNKITSSLFSIKASPFFSTNYDGYSEIIIKVLLTVFLTLFTVATLNLNVHFSNLCHRGLVTNGLYGIVRHPAYTCKLISWALVIGLLNGSNLAIWASYLVWVTIYVLRAITEERHLGRVDPAYLQYCQKVKYRFIPGLV